MDELVDVIDPAGNTIGVVTRQEMRAKRLPHRCTYVLVFNNNDELFIHLRTATKDVYPSFWDVCIGGVLSAGENFEDGVKREIREELGVDANAQPLFTVHHEDNATFAYGMAYRLLHEGPFQLQVEEIVCGEFVPLDEVHGRIAQAPFCPDGVGVLKKYLEHLKEPTCMHGTT
jgi:isopentenyldiphosphate isomerase